MAADLALSPEKANVLGRKSPNNEAQLPQSLHSGSGDEGRNESFNSKGPNFDIQHVSPRGELQQVSHVNNLVSSGPQVPVTSSIAESH